MATITSTTTPPKVQLSTSERVVELLNAATLEATVKKKCQQLGEVQELLINREPALLDNFLDEVLGFQTDNSAEVRKFIIGFIEAACKTDLDVLPKVLTSLNTLLHDDNVGVVKKSIVTLGNVFSCTFKWLASAPSPSDMQRQCWTFISELKTAITDLLSTNNTGIKMTILQFLEKIALALSYSQGDDTKDVCLDILKTDTEVLKVKQLEREGRQIIDSLLNFLAADNIEAVTLQVVITSVANIARLRSQFCDTVVKAFELLHVNLPPGLTQSQVKSIRIHLKRQLLTLLRFTKVVSSQGAISALLFDLGATSAEIGKVTPKVEATVKRRAADVSAVSAKVPKVEADEDEDTKPADAVEKLMAELIPKLTPDRVTRLVVVSMVMLPDQMPSSFAASYTPIAQAGTEQQIKHMARLLAVQMLAPGMRQSVKSSSDVAAGSTSSDKSEPTPTERIMAQVQLPSLGQQPRGTTRRFQLADVTHSMSSSDLLHHSLNAYNRILRMEPIAKKNNQMTQFNSTVIKLAVMFPRNASDLLFDFCLREPMRRLDLMLGWLYSEYAAARAFLSPEQRRLDVYDKLLTRLLTGVLSLADQKQTLFNRLFLEAPVITASAISLLKCYCQEDVKVYFGMTTLNELILKRQADKELFLGVMLDFSVHERAIIRGNSVKVLQRLYEREEFTTLITKYAISSASYLQHSQPPSELVRKGFFLSIKTEDWGEELVHASLYLLLALLPISPGLLHQLATVYIKTSASVKRIFLRLVDDAVLAIGQDNTDLLKFVDECPAGAETLVTRMAFVLTDASPASEEFVSRVFALYESRVKDVRFLIPVMNRLSAKQVADVMPAILKLNPTVVKETIYKLLTGPAPVFRPARLLVLLHNIPDSACDLKTIVKAMNVLLTDKTMFSADVLDSALTELADQDILPTLLLRTLIQALVFFPSLLKLTIHILKKLITKQVWTNGTLWQGFVKCCQHAKPASFEVLLQLPPDQLSLALSAAEDLREPLTTFVNQLAPTQLAKVRPDLLVVLQLDRGGEPTGGEDVQQLVPV